MSSVPLPTITCLLGLDSREAAGDDESISVCQGLPSEPVGPLTGHILRWFMSGGRNPFVGPLLFLVTPNFRRNIHVSFRGSGQKLPGLPRLSASTDSTLHFSTTSVRLLFVTHLSGRFETPVVFYSSPTTRTSKDRSWGPSHFLRTHTSPLTQRVLWVSSSGLQSGLSSDRKTMILTLVKIQNLIGKVTQTTPDLHRWF